MAPHIARAAATPGVTDTEIRIGNTNAYSGPASAYGTISKAEAAYFKMINDQGGVNGRKITYISYDDGYNPAKTVEMTRKLIEQDEVALLLNPLGTATNTAIVKYVNQKGVPHLFISTGADKWADYKEHPWTLMWAPSYRVEAQIYAKYARAQRPDSKIGLLYQNDDFGKDYVQGFRDVLGDDFAKRVTTASYEVTDATVESQLISLKGTGADVFMNAATPKFAAQAVRGVFETGWKPLHIMSNVSLSAASVMIPAGAERGIGVVTSAYLKDASDPHWKDDPGILEWQAFMKKWMPDGDMVDTANVFGFGVGHTMVTVLKQCGNDLSRRNIMDQALRLNELDNPVTLPGMRIQTSPTNYRPMRQLQMMRWNGKSWELFGDLIEGAGS
jgi:branched-chain amino acid transport system substrate-binding protein